MCHMSGVICHVSGVTSQVSGVRGHMSGDFLFCFLNGGAYRGRVCYQQGLPRLVFKFYDNFCKGQVKTKVTEEYILYLEDQGNNSTTSIPHHLAFFHQNEDPVEGLQLKRNRSVS